MNKATNEGKAKRVQAGIAVLALGAVVVGVAIATSHKTSLADAGSSSSSSSSSKASSTSASSTSTNSSGVDYKDGSYTATGSYYSPGGKETVKVSLSLSDDKVVTASVQSGANDPTAESYQTIFIGGYKSYVIGKKINSIKLTNVSGSSLTSQGFNNALEQIEKQAKA